MYLATITYIPFVLFYLSRYKSLSSLQLTPPDSNSTTPISTTPKGQQQQQLQQQQQQHHQQQQQDILIIKSNNHNNINMNNQLSKSASIGAAREGTLDSSRSGGRTSGDSKLPEKKTRRLSRPRSLSNLVWDLKPLSKEKSSKKKLYIHHFDHRQQATLYL